MLKIISPMELTVSLYGQYCGLWRQFFEIIAQNEQNKTSILNCKMDFIDIYRNGHRICTKYT